jgi:hypothetical protein
MTPIFFREYDLPTMSTTFRKRCMSMSFLTELIVIDFHGCFFSLSLWLLLYWWLAKREKTDLNQPKLSQKPFKIDWVCLSEGELKWISVVSRDGQVKSKNDLNQVKSSQVKSDLTWLESFFFNSWLDLTWLEKPRDLTGLDLKVFLDDLTWLGLGLSS